IPGAIRALENRAGQGWDWWKGVAHGAGDVTKQVLQDAGVPERYARIPADYGVEPIVKYAPAMALAETAAPPLLEAAAPPLPNAPYAGPILSAAARAGRALLRPRWGQELFQTAEGPVWRAVEGTGLGRLPGMLK